MSNVSRSETQSPKSIIVGIICVVVSMALFNGVLPALGVNLPSFVGGVLGGAVGVLAWFAIIKRGKA